ncbi:MAG: ABC transporter substrate-binding protein, partial [Actinomycetota bacterium]|nr:ABC transporter substrate-binding protein [Actinomycetota bacterium]
EYYSVSWGYMRCCLLRTLVSYPGVPGDEGGNDLVPDIATDLPTVSDDELTWTFTLKEGIEYAPPFRGTEVVAQDFIRAIERVACTECASGGYPFYYSIIEGFDEFSEGKADTISGLNAPDDQTLEVTLSEPSGDLPFVMAMPAAAPIPEGAADGHEKDYGRFLVATGPYMFEGSEDLDFSLPPKEQEPVAGYTPGKSFSLVRNPSWDPDTDEIREAFVDRIDTVIGGTEQDLANKVDQGLIDINGDFVPPAQVLREYQTDPQKRARLSSNPADTLYYISFNLAEPPFDDEAVRRALNFATNKEGMIRIKGGPLFGEPAGHIIPDSLLDDTLADFDPFASEASQGDVDAAKEEMKKSKYDTDQDGVCDAPECKGILAVTDESDPYPDYVPLLQDAWGELGIEMDVKQLERTTMYDKCLDPGAHTAICLGPGWGKDFPDATTFAGPLFGSEGLGPDACCNYSLLGASPEHLKKFDYEITEVPSVDEDIEACEPLAGDERIECWSNLDQKLTDELAVWIPYLFAKDVFITSERVRGFTYDQFSGQPAYDHMGVVEEGA